MNPDPTRSAITEILARHGDGTPPIDLLVPVIYGELRRLAAARLRGERPDHTLSPTALVHEAFLRLLGDDEIPMRSRAHVFGAAARAMRQVLVDHARRRRAAKRGFGWQRITLEVEGGNDASRDVEFLALHTALERLEAVDARAARLVELRFFGGLTLDEAARVLGVSRRTVANDWVVTRAWLRRELEASD
jgi:RNA polymerase sigma factor (TIGR02999 family)